MELYKKYRPEKFKDVVGNRNVLLSLSGMIRDKTLPQVILFTGPAGCGKTTLARIIQNNLGCANMDKQEVNASSIRGIDSIRDLEQERYLSPIGKSRVWILDEVHKWTSDAQSASLKLMEDTPTNVYFFLCTTNPEKLSRALRSRCTHVAVAGLSTAELVKVLWRVCYAEKIEVDDDSLNLIAFASDGSARIALVYLDRLRQLKPDQWADSIAAGAEGAPGVIELCRALVAKHKWKSIARLLADIKDEPESVRRMVLAYFNTVLLKSGSQSAYEVIQCFAEPFYNTGKAGLTASCWEAINPGGDEIPF